jgi:hypothetical protein
MRKSAENSRRIRPACPWSAAISLSCIDKPSLVSRVHAALRRFPQRAHQWVPGRGGKYWLRKRIRTPFSLLEALYDCSRVSPNK